jgi:hypothetical protein
MMMRIMVDLVVVVVFVAVVVVLLLLLMIMITTTMMFMIELLLSCFGSRGRMRIKLCKGICKRSVSPTRTR